MTHSYLYLLMNQGLLPLTMLIIMSCNGFFPPPPVTFPFLGPTASASDLDVNSPVLLAPPLPTGIWPLISPPSTSSVMGSLLGGHGLSTTHPSTFQKLCPQPSALSIKMVADTHVIV
jgi:hypothetical protein